MKTIEDFEKKLNLLVDEFKAFKDSTIKEVELIPGQRWKHDDGCEYILSTFRMPYETTDQYYVLIDLEYGYYWHDPSKNIQDVFSYCRDEFELIKDA